MATKVILVGINLNNNKLILRNQGNSSGNADLETDVDPGDTIQWLLDPDNSGNGLAIQHIRKDQPGDPGYDPNAIDLLTQDPYRAPDTRIWTGNVVFPSPGRGRFEKYKIGYTVNGVSGTLWDDPKLQMNT
jgi:hypothetical protein